jgi:RNA polymerase sigma-70 factor (ECF subfamily)
MTRIPADEPSDEVLVQRAASGDEQAIEILYERYADSLFAFIYHHLDGDRPDVEDIWQETLAAAFRSLGSYRGQAHFFTWLCSIARHKIADHLHRQRMCPAEQFSDVPEPRLSVLVAGGPLPEEVLMNRANRVRVVEALARVSQNYRLALIARYGDGLGVEEVATLIGRTYKATESLLSRARSALREAIGELEEESR